ncbi:MAG: CC0125/CC1285 family lipoprotein [Brevundimonas sp.]
MKALPMKTLAMTVAAGLALAACATATPYQPAGFNGQRGGYAEQRLENDRFRVSFSGNSLTSREQVEQSLLLRSAELTVESGYDWFSTVNRATDRDTRFVGTPDPFYAGYNRFYSPYWGPSWRYYRSGFWSPWDRYGPWGANDFDVRQVDRFEANAEIVLGRGPKPAGDPNAFDAREVIQNLGPQVTRPAA